MQRTLLKSKIHRVVVTDANLDYEGSIAIDESLLEVSGILPFEKVAIYNITNGSRFETYAIKAERNSGTISINGAAAHLAKKGDIVIVASYSLYEEREALSHRPILVYVDEKNRVKHISAEMAYSI
ncbi:MAG: aspartate 1-decarboxylase [Deltaproteobacteria bacterium]|nr:aspartate 1-decarboxylase [Deltaproteobacteria bacterium]